MRKKSMTLAEMAEEIELLKEKIQLLEKIKTLLAEIKEQMVIYPVYPVYPTYPPNTVPPYISPWVYYTTGDPLPPPPGTYCTNSPGQNCVREHLRGVE